MEQKGEKLQARITRLNMDGSLNALKEISVLFMYTSKFDVPSKNKPGINGKNSLFRPKMELKHCANLRLRE